MSLHGSKLGTVSRPLVMHHLLLLQGNDATWISRPAFKGCQKEWRDQPPVHSAKIADPLFAAANLFKRAPRGRLKMADKLTVLLGYPYVRHTVLPWRADLGTAAHWKGYAGARFDEQHGRSAFQKIAVDPAAFGQPRLATATDAAFVQSLQTLARVHKLRLVSCTSLLTAAVRNHRDLLEDDCVLCLPQQNSLECLFREQGMWQGVCGMPTSPDTAWADSMARAATLAGVTVSHGPVLAVTPSNQMQESVSAIRRLGAAHPWLEDSGDGSSSGGFADSDARNVLRSSPVAILGRFGLPIPLILLMALIAGAFAFWEYPRAMWREAAAAVLEQRMHTPQAENPSIAAAGNVVTAGEIARDQYVAGNNGTGGKVDDRAVASNLLAQDGATAEMTALPTPRRSPPRPAPYVIPSQALKAVAKADAVSVSLPERDPKGHATASVTPPEALPGRMPQYIAVPEMTLREHARLTSGASGQDATSPDDGLL